MFQSRHSSSYKGHPPFIKGNSPNLSMHTPFICNMRKFVQLLAFFAIVLGAFSCSSDADLDVLPAAQPFTINSISPSCVQVGTQVSIRGENFTEDISISLQGQTVSSIFLRSSALIEFNVPSGLDGGLAELVLENDTTNLSSELQIIGSGSWSRKTATFPGEGRGTQLWFTIGSKLYYGGGLQHTTATQLHDFWEYDIEEDQWMQLTDPSDQRIRRANTATSLNSKGYIMSSNVFFSYDPTTDTWTELARVPTDKGLSGVSITGFKDRIMLAFDAGDDPSELWGYDIASDTWTQLGEIPEALASRFFVIEDILYAGTSLESNRLFQFDESTNTWTELASAPEESVRYFHVGGTNGSNIYVGINGSGSLDADGVFTGNFDSNIYEYLPNCERWIEKADFPQAGREGTISFGYDGKFFVGFGFDGTFHNSIWELDPDS